MKKTNFDGATTEKIKKDLNELEDRLFKPKIRLERIRIEIRKDLYRMENTKIKEIEKTLKLNLKSNLEP